MGVAYGERTKHIQIGDVVLSLGNSGVWYEICKACASLAHHVKAMFYPRHQSFWVWSLLSRCVYQMDISCVGKILRKYSPILSFCQASIEITKGSCYCCCTTVSLLGTILSEDALIFDDVLDPVISTSI